MPEDLDEKYGTPEECPKGGAHEIDATSVQIYDQHKVSRVDDMIVDFNCRKCGRSGSTGLVLADPNW